MATEVWRPLSARESGDNSLVDGVPEYLERSLRDWIDEYTTEQPWLVERIMVRLSIRWTPDTESYAEGYGKDEDARFWLAYRAEPSQLLDIIDAFLNLLPILDPLPEGATRAWVSDWVATAEMGRARLSLLLEDARSVYELTPQGSGLRRRIPEYSARAIDAAVAAADARTDAGSASRQLRAASDAIRGINPNPPLAYSLAIKAVESAAHSLIEPTNGKATLGTMIRHMNANPRAFTLVIPGPDGTGDIAPVLAIMTLLWQGQTSRHGAQTPTRDETADEAMMAVEIATSLVSWFVAGRVSRRL